MRVLCREIHRRLPDSLFKPRAIAIVSTIPRTAALIGHFSHSVILLFFKEINMVGRFCHFHNIIKLGNFPTAMDRYAIVGVILCFGALFFLGAGITGASVYTSDSPYSSSIGLVLLATLLFIGGRDLDKMLEHEGIDLNGL